MDIRQGFMMEHGSDYRLAFAAAADAGFDHVELNVEARFSRGAVDTGAVRAAAADRGLDLIVHLPYTVGIGSPHELAQGRMPGSWRPASTLPPSSAPREPSSTRGRSPGCSAGGVGGRRRDSRARSATRRVRTETRHHGLCREPRGQLRRRH